MLTVKNTGLIIIDVQGKLADVVHDSQTLQEQIRRLIQGANVLQLPIVWMEQLPDKLGRTKPQLAELIFTEPLPKSTFSGWQTAAIRQAILDTGRQHWLVLGIEAHVCVYQTVADLLANGLHTHLVVDAISSRTQSNKELAISKMQQLGSQLTSVEMALFELQQVAEGAVFKELIQIIK